MKTITVDNALCVLCGSEEGLHLYQHELYCVNHWNELQMTENLMNAGNGEKRMPEINSIIDAESQAIELNQQLTAIVITGQLSYDVAVEARTKSKNWLKSANDWFDSIQKPAYETYKGILDKRKQVCDPVDRQVAAINRALINFDAEQERIRRREQWELEERARKEAEAQKLADAVHLEETGADEETVEAVLSAPVQVTAPMVAAPTYERSSAVVYKDNWGGEVTDLWALIKAVAKDKSKINLLQVNQPALNQLAKALKETMSIPGVRPVNNKVVATGRG